MMEGTLVIHTAIEEERTLAIPTVMEGGKLLIHSDCATAKQPSVLFKQ